MINFRVKNFEKYQSYKDRNPNWIKLYTQLLDNYEFGALSDASKSHLILIFLLASKRENVLPWDSHWIAARIQAKTKVNLDEIEQLGFIEKIVQENHIVRTYVEESTQVVPPEERREENKLPCATELRETGINPRALGTNPRAMTGEKSRFLELFDQFWAAYPKRKSKGDALKAWLALRPDEQFVAKILQGIEQAKKSDQWRKDAGQFIPFPATWLRAKCWEDDYKVEVQQTRPLSSQPAVFNYEKPDDPEVWKRNKELAAQLAKGIFSEKRL